MSKLQACNVPSLISKFVKLRQETIIMAFAYTGNAKLEYFLALHLINFIGRPTVSLEAAKNLQELVTNSYVLTQCSITSSSKKCRW